MDHFFISFIRQVKTDIRKNIVLVPNGSRITDIQVTGQFFHRPVVDLIGTLPEKVFIFVIVKFQVIGRVEFVGTIAFFGNSETQGRF